MVSCLILYVLNVSFSLNIFTVTMDCLNVMLVLKDNGDDNHVFIKYVT